MDGGRGDSGATAKQRVRGTSCAKETPPPPPVCLVSWTAGLPQSGRERARIERVNPGVKRRGEGETVGTGASRLVGAQPVGLAVATCVSAIWVGVAAGRIANDP